MQASPAQTFAKFGKFLVSAFGEVTGGKLYQTGLELESHEEREQYFRTLTAEMKRVIHGEGGNPVPALQYKYPIVDCETFIRDPFYMGLDKEVYPELMSYLKDMNSGRFVEIVLTGGIGSGKTTLAVWTQAYQLYLLSALKNPHAVFELERASEIEIIFQSITASLAESVDYARFKSLILRSPYFMKHFPPDPTLKSELHFPNRIIVKPVSGSNLATIGQNVISGLIDELNYMAVVDSSKKSVDAGTYNQAIEVYNSIARRRKSRFLKQGRMPGILCLVSSKKYPGQFTDEKIEEAKEDPTIYVYDKRVWEIKPDSFSKKRFKVFIGDETRKPKILDEGEKIRKEDKDLIIEVPEDFKQDFKKDIVNALREIAGVSHLSKYPFFTDPEPVLKSFKKNAVSIFSRETVDFETMKCAVVKNAIKHPEYPRFVHLDLALTGDCAGFAIGHCPGFMTAATRDTDEKMPIIRIDGALEIRPPPNGEIPFWRIRKLLYVLRDLGVNVRWVTMDSFQSADTVQVLRQRGFVVGVQSVDLTMGPYDFYKSAVYEGRMIMPIHAKLQKEMRDLQLDTRKRKVDHLPTGSKDVADAVAGVVFGLTLRREIWAMHGIPVGQIPPEIIMAAKAQSKKVKEGTVVENETPDDD